MLGQISLVKELWMHGMSCLSVWLIQNCKFYQGKIGQILCIREKKMLSNFMPRVFKRLEAGCLQVNLY